MALRSEPARFISLSKRMFFQIQIALGDLRKSPFVELIMAQGVDMDSAS